jgi:DNA-binding transcriptional LysR family regulator
MNLRFVEAFYWVATLRSVTRAAEKLFLTQSAMSSRIATLEEELGVLLLDRRDKQFRLTVAGSRFLVYAQRLLELQREIKSEMGSEASSAVSMRIGAIESVLHSWLVPWIERLRLDFPELELELSVDTSPILADQVSRGTQDLVFAAVPATGEDVRNAALQPMKMAFIGHKHMDRKRRYTLAEIARREILTFQRGSQPHVMLLELFRQLGEEPGRIHTVSSVSAMIQLVQGGLGIATLPLQAVQRLNGYEELKVLACDASLVPLPIHASYRTDPTSRVVERVLSSAIAFVDGPDGLKGKR